MAASAKVITLENHTSNGDWKIVIPRRGKQRRHLPNIRPVEKQQQPWTPTDAVTDANRESRLIQKMHISMKRMENSQFYQNFLDQIQTSEIMDCFHRVLGSELKMQMVIYGIGSIESYETPRFQLSLAILIKRKFAWIGDIDVFDPVLSTTESQVLQTLGCSVLSINEQGRRHVLKPTLFFMPHCEAELYDNLLQANWKAEMLNRIVLFGNSFQSYNQYVSEFKNSIVVDSSKHILAVHQFANEFEVKTVSNDYFGAFHDSSWHFFGSVPDTELKLVGL